MDKAQNTTKPQSNQERNLQIILQYNLQSNFNNFKYQYENKHKFILIIFIVMNSFLKIQEQSDEVNNPQLYSNIIQNSTNELKNSQTYHSQQISSQNENLDNIENYTKMFEYILSHNSELQDKMEVINLLEQILFRRELPSSTIKILKQISDNKDDPLNPKAIIILNQIQAKKLQKSSAAITQMKQKTVMISKQKVTLKSQNNFRSNILDLNLKQKVGKRTQYKNELVTQNINTNKSTNNLVDQYGEANTSSWRTSLGEIQKYLIDVRNDKILNYEDLKYIFSCLYTLNSMHKVGRCDPAIFQILKYCVQKTKTIPDGFFIAINRILRNDIKYVIPIIPKKQQKKSYFSNFFGIMKEIANISTGTMLSRYSLDIPLYPREIEFHIRNSVPDILLNYVQKDRVLDYRTIDALRYSVKQYQQQNQYAYYKIISTLALSVNSINNINLLNDISLDISDQTLPETFTIYYQTLAKFGNSKQAIKLNFLQKAIYKINTLEDAYYFFGRRAIRPFNYSYTKNYSIYQSNYLATLSLCNNSSLTQGDLGYLIQNFQISGGDNEHLIKNYRIIQCIKRFAYYGNLLPQKVIKSLINAFLNNRIEINMKKHLLLVLFYIFRNGQKIQAHVLDKMNNLLNQGRTFACNAIGFYAQKYDIYGFNNSKQLCDQLKKIIQDRDPTLKKAAVFAFNNIINKSEQQSVDGLQNQLLKQPELINSFFKAALRKQLLTQSACQNIYKLLQNIQYQKQIRINSAFTLSIIAENPKQKFPKEILRLTITQILNDKQVDIRNHIGNMIYGYAKNNINEVLKIQKVIEILCKNIIKHADSAVNIVFALRFILQTVQKQKVSSALFQIDSDLFFYLINLLNNEQQYHIDSRHNTAISLAYLVKNGCKMKKRQVNKSIQIINNINDQQMKKSLISTIGYALKNQGFLLFNDLIIQNLINLLSDDSQDLTDSARVILEEYLNLSKYQISKQIIQELIKSIENINASLNASYLLRIYSVNSNSKLIAQEQIFKISSLLNRIENPESIINISYIVMRQSQKLSQSLDERILNNLEPALEFNDLEALQNIVFAIKYSVIKNSKLSYNLMMALCDLLNNQEKGNLKIKQQIACILSLLSEEFDSSAFTKILNTIVDGFQINNQHINSYLLKVIGNYYRGNPDEQESIEEVLIPIVEKHFNSLDTLQNGLYALKYILDYGQQISTQSLDVVAGALLKFKNPIREYSRDILNHYDSSVFSNYVKDIFDIQTLATKLYKNNQDLVALSQLLQFVKKGRHVTVSVFDALEILINKETLKLKIFDLLIKINQNQQQIPNSLTMKLTDQLKLTSVDKINQDILKLLLSITQNSSGLPKDLINVIEEKLQAGLISNNAFQILQIAYRRNYAFNKDSIINNLIRSVNPNFCEKQLSKICKELTSKLQNYPCYYFFCADQEIQNPELSKEIKLCTQKILMQIQKIKDFNIICKAGLMSDTYNCLQNLIKNYGYFDSNLSIILNKSLNSGFRLAQDTLLTLRYKFSNTAQKLKNQIFNILSISENSSNIDNSEYLLNFLLNSYGQKSNSLNHFEEKSLQELLEEIKHGNKNQHIFRLIDDGYFTKRIRDIKNAGNNKSLFVQFITRIKDWDKDQIKNWSRIIKRDFKEFNQKHKILLYNEIFAVIQRAIIIDSNRNDKNYQLRIVQLLSILIMLESDKNILSQISTGEGKSSIISILATIKALEGLNVDVITSSLVLAKRDSEAKKSFYDMFNLNVKHNGDDNYKFKGVKGCYQKDVDIIYGDAGGFQFDILRHQYSNLNTRGQRDFKNTVVIIDEVDSLLIDDCSKIAMLADSMPGMCNLSIIFVQIWKQLSQIIKRFEYNEGKLFYNEGKLQNNLPTSEELDPGQYIATIKRELQKYIDQILLSSIKKDSETRIGILQHFTDFIKNQKNKWISSAIQARFIYKNSHHYLINKDSKGISRITPIDYSNTGIIQNSTTWGDGLQQFLQIKQGLQLTPETLITNFLSNKAYITRYRNRVYGLTGTLGSAKAKQFLRNLYDVNFITIPRFKHSHFIQKQAIITENQEQWRNTIKNTTLEQVKNGRAALIICESKKQASILHSEFTSIYRKQNLPGNIFIYTRDDNIESKAVENTFNPGDIMIATNLAGRGTDIQTSKMVQNKGGLYVCVTYLPLNLRVQQQAFGRTARKGHKGSAQLILNKQNLKNDNYFECESIVEIKKARDAQEKIRLDRFQIYDLPQINLKDQFFQQFCKLLNQIRKQQQKSQSDNGFNYHARIMAQLYSQHNLQAIEERWGLFLKLADFSNTQLVKNKFRQFISDIYKQYIDNNVILNPSYYVKLGNALIDYANTIKGKLMNIDNGIFKKAYQCFIRAIQLDGNQVLYQAYYKRAHTQILIKQENYKDRALENLQLAHNIIKDVIEPQLMVMKVNFNLNNDTNHTQESQFQKQISNKINILQALAGSIQNSISVINKSRKQIEIRCNDSNKIEKVKSKQQAQELLYNQFKASSNLILSFYNLKNYSDLSTQYPALTTLQNALKKYPNIKVSIIFNNLTAENAKQILPEFKKQVEQKKNSEQKKQRQKQSQHLAKESISQEQYNQLKFYQFKFLKHHLNKGKQKIVSVGKQISSRYTELKSSVTNAIYSLQHNYQKAKQIPIILSLESLRIKNALQLVSIYLNQQTKDEVQQIIVQLNDDEFKCKYFSEMRKFLKEKIEKINADFKNNNLSKDQNKDLDKDEIEKLNNQNLDKQLVDLKITNISQKKSNIFIEKSICQNISISFINLNNQDAERIVWFNQKKIVDAAIRFNNLNTQQTKYIIHNAVLGEQKVDLAESKLIQDIFLSTDTPITEIAEAKAQGLNTIIQLYEQQPIKWCSLGVVLVIGVAQIVGGVFGVMAGGNPIGTASISQGVGDIINAIRGAVTRKFSWEDYAIQKTISLAISLTTAGLGKGGAGTGIIESVDNQCLAFKNEGFKFIEKNFSSNIINQGTKLTSKGFISQGMKQQLKTAIKYTVKQLGESGFTQLLNYGANKLSKFGLDELEPQITQTVQNSLYDVFNHEKIKNAITIDKYNKNQKFNNEIIKIAEKIINPRNNTCLSNLSSYIKGVISGRSQKIGNYINMAQNIGGTIFAIDKVVNIVDDFVYKFKNRLNSMHLDKPIDLIVKEVDITERNRIIHKLQSNQIVKNGTINNQMIFQQIVKKVRQQKYTIDQVNKGTQILMKIDLGKHDSNIKEKIKEFSKVNREVHSSQINILQKKIAQMLIKIIIQTIQNKFISPLTRMAVNKTVRYVSQKIQKKLNCGKTVMEEIQLLKSAQRMKGKLQNYMNRISQQEKQKYKGALNNAINLAKNGKGDLLHLMVMIDQLKQNGQDISVNLYKDGKFHSTIGSNNGKTISLDLTDQHWALVNKQGMVQNAQKTGSNKNDCLFNCIAAHTNKSADELRNLTATSLEKNEKYIHFMQDYQNLRNNQQWFGGTMSGGYIKDKELCQATLEKKKIQVLKKQKKLILTNHKFGKQPSEYDNINFEQQCKVYQKNGQLYYCKSKTIVPDLRNALWVMDEEGAMYIVSVEGKNKNVKHTYILKGKDKDDPHWRYGHPVAGAGEITMKDGKILRLDNNSGHYECKEDQMKLAIKNIPKGCFSDRMLTNYKQKVTQISDEEQERIIKKYQNQNKNTKKVESVQSKTNTKLQTQKISKRVKKQTDINIKNRFVKYRDIIKCQNYTIIQKGNATINIGGNSKSKKK